jgi:hypothetical protein
MPSIKVCIGCGCGIPMNASPSRCEKCLPAWRERRRQQDNEYKKRHRASRQPVQAVKPPSETLS